MNKTYIIVAVIIVLLIAGFVYFSGGPQSTYQPPSTAEAPGAMVDKEPPATGSVDDAVNAILQDTLTDEAPAAETDPTLTAENQQALDGFGQALDASSF